MTEIEIPTFFMKIPYNGELYPGNSKTCDISVGANCQLFAYSILKHFGAHIPDFRSSELWADKEFTFAVNDYEPLDLALFNKTRKSWGAHVALFISKKRLVHLSKKQGYPTIYTLNDFLKMDEYRHLIGVKRLKSKYRPNKMPCTEIEVAFQEVEFTSEAEAEADLDRLSKFVAQRILNMPTFPIRLSGGVRQCYFYVIHRPISRKRDKPMSAKRPFYRFGEKSNAKGSRHL